MSSDSEEDFEDQIRQEEQAKQIEIDKDTDVIGQSRTRRDEDGTEYEWDMQKKAWFPKIDADFIAQYQMNYGTCDSTQPTTGATSTATDTSTAISTATDISTDTATTASSVGDTTTLSATNAHYAYWYQHYYSAANSNSGTTTTDSKVYEEYYKYCQQYYEWQQSQQQDGADSQSYDSTETTKTVASTGAQNSSDEYYNQCYSLQQSGKDTDWDAYWAQYYNYQPSAQEKEASEEKSDSLNKPGEKDEDGKNVTDPKGIKRKQDPTWFNIEEDKNTNVYVTGLPNDITEDEYKDMMNKFGLIMFDARTRKPKLKLYRDDKGNLKGDGLCCYIKSESVDLALQILDGSEMRGFKITVERAKFELKGSFDAKKRKKKLSNREKKKFLEKQQKLFDWRPDKPLGTRERRERTVIIKNVFVSKEIEENPVMINELSMDLRQECEKYGDVRKVVIYDRHSEGVAAVTFKEAEEADICIEAVNGRWFAKRQLTAETWDGRTKYEVKESEAERESRLKSWEKYLEKGEEGGEKSSEGDGDCEASKEVAKSKEDVDSTKEMTDQPSKTAEKSQDSGINSTPSEVKATGESDEGEVTPSHMEVEEEGKLDQTVGATDDITAADTDSGGEIDDEDPSGRETPPLMS